MPSREYAIHECNDGRPLKEASIRYDGFDDSAKGAFVDTEKCRALICAVERGSMSAAASYLGYTASGVSRMIDALEADLGIKLVARGPRGVVLTSDGVALEPYLRDVAQAAERARQQTAAAKGLLEGEIAVASYASTAATWLPRILQAFQVRHPKIRVRTMEAGNEQLVSWVEQRTIDCAIFAKRPFRGDWIALRTDPLVAWLPANHPRAGESAFPLRELDGAPFVETSPNQNTDITQLLTAEGLHPDIRCTTTSSYTSYRLVEAGLGISLNNKLMARGWVGDVVELPFSPPRSVELGIAVPSLVHASLAAQEFIACARSVVADEGL